MHAVDLQSSRSVAQPTTPRESATIVVLTEPYQGTEAIDTNTHSAPTGVFFQPGPCDSYEYRWLEGTALR